MTGTTSNAFNIIPGAAAKVVFGVQPSTTAAGSSIAPAMTVQVQDTGGNLVTGSTALVTLTIGANPAAWHAQWRCGCGCGQWRRDFQRPFDQQGRHRLHAGGVERRPGRGDQRGVQHHRRRGLGGTVDGERGPGLGGGRRSATSIVTVTLKDANGNPVGGKAVSLSQGTGSSTISAPTGPSNASGLVTFNVNSTKAETVTYTAADTTDSIGITQTAAVTFKAGPLDHFAFGTISSPQTAGTAFNVTITAQDVNNNTVTSFDGNGFKAVLSSTGTLVGAPITTPSFTAGVLTQSVTITNTGTFTITAVGNGNDSGVTGTSNSFTVNPGVPAKLAFGQQPTTANAAQTITPAVTVRILDANGNLTTSGASVTLAISPNPTSAVLGGTLTQAAVNGVATFGNLSVSKSGTYTLAASSPGLTGASSASFTINNPAPTLTSIAPVSGNLTQTLSVVFTGTNFLPGITTVSLGANIADQHVLGRQRVADHSECDDRGKRGRRSAQRVGDQ